MKQILKRLTYANVMSSIAVFLVLGGGAAIAANQLAKNSVGKKQIKANAVTAVKIKKNAVTNKKLAKNSVTANKVKADSLTGAQINESTLGTVPNAALANAIPPAEATHLVGTPGQPGFEAGSKNADVPPGSPIRFGPVGFFKDQQGLVHLEGVAQAGPATGSPAVVFTLPPGYRPASTVALPFNFGAEGQALVLGSNIILEGIDLSGKIVGEAESAVVLDGIVFRPGS